MDGGEPGNRCQLQKRRSMSKEDGVLDNIQRLSLRVGDIGKKADAQDRFGLSEAAHSEENNKAEIRSHAIILAGLAKRARNSR